MHIEAVHLYICAFVHRHAGVCRRAEVQMTSILLYFGVVPFLFGLRFHPSIEQSSTKTKYKNVEAQKLKRLSQKICSTVKRSKVRQLSARPHKNGHANRPAKTKKGRGRRDK